jgi:5-formyltetrahydrofolate cyclo-ligase
MAETARRDRVEPGTIVSGFWPIRSEVDVRPLMFALREKGARLCLPAILDRTTIVFRELVRGAPLVDMGFGTAGPGEEAAVLDPQVMLVPLAAFDRRGHRIGYGAGFYDRAIARLRSDGTAAAPRSASPSTARRSNSVPDEAHDVVIAEILTESGLRRSRLLAKGFAFTAHGRAMPSGFLDATPLPRRHGRQTGRTAVWEQLPG